MVYGCGYILISGDVVVVVDGSGLVVGRGFCVRIGGGLDFYGNIIVRIDDDLVSKGGGVIIVCGGCVLGGSVLVLFGGSKVITDGVFLCVGGWFGGHGDYK